MIGVSVRTLQKKSTEEDEIAFESTRQPLSYLPNPCRVNSPGTLSHHHHHLSLNREGRWGTTDDFTTCFIHVSLFSATLWDLANPRPVHSLMLSSHLFLCLSCLLLPFTVPCKMVLARPDEWATCLYHFSLPLFTTIRGSSCGQIACWILARTFSLVTWSSYEMCSILR